MCVQLLGGVWLFATPWTVASQAPLSMEFSRSGLHFLLQGIFLTQGSNPCLLCPLHWQVDSLPLRHLGSLKDQELVLKLRKLGGWVNQEAAWSGFDWWGLWSNLGGGGKAWTRTNEWRRADQLNRWCFERQEHDRYRNYAEWQKSLQQTWCGHVLVRC